MVKKQNKDITKSLNSKGSEQKERRARKIDASTIFETCTEQISPFGGLLGLIKFLDLIKLEEVFDHLYIAPHRKVRLGNHRMVIGIIMLLFIGFNRLWHFTYIRLGAIICGFFGCQAYTGCCPNNTCKYYIFDLESWQTQYI